jgi:cytochrome oxidase Cu insertion factor (SCO1/SenC/PrrC family)
MTSALRVRRRPRAWPLGRAATGLLLAGSLAAGVLLALVLRPSLAPAPGQVSPAGDVPSRALAADAVWRPGEKAAPPFTLRDQSNRLVSLGGQRGHPLLLTFMDSHCKLICTLQGPSIAHVLQRLGSRSPVRLLVVSVNPWQDTAASSAAAGARYGFSGHWHWLRGSPAELRQVWSSYGIGVRFASGDVNHSTAIYLIDGRGYERAGFNFPFRQSRVVSDLRKLSAAPG